MMAKFFIFIFLIVLSTFANAVDEVEDSGIAGLKLIVGSSRTPGIVANPWARKSFGNKVSCKYRNDPTVTTVDIGECAVAGVPHIKADVRYFTPEGPVISAVLELFPSIDPTVAGGDRLMPDALRNLAQYMPRGATLEIYHSPLVSLSPADKFMAYCRDRDKIRRDNPFHGFYSFWIMRALEQALEENENTARQWWETQYSRLFNVLHQHEGLEQKTACNITQGILVEYVARELRLSIQTVFKRVATSLNQTEENIRAQIKKDVEAYNKNIDDFMCTNFLSSLSYYVVTEVVMEMQQPLMADFLTSIGFTDIHFERGKSDYDGRKNLWQIKATKGEVAPSTRCRLCVIL